MNPNYELVVGLEIHAELSTESKIYCSCKNKFGLEVNTQCCPICMGMPGTLPTLNQTVVEYAVLMGHALHCDINRICKQDRKNYFYPDLPKSYQISQFDIPLCENGYVDILTDGVKKRIGITRIHIEEDAGKLIHDSAFDGSLVDFNRCGVPLIEIVSEPDLRSSAEAKAYLETIRSILACLQISDCKMQEGSIRCDVNVSVMKKGSKTFGTRCEMKNVNTFSGTVRAIEYEANRQISILENGGTIRQETRRWDDAKGESVLLRTKEDAQDYRYFPEPDLGTICLEQSVVDALKARIPELPNKKIMRFMESYALNQNDATLLVDSDEKAALFEQTLACGKIQPKTLANWILVDLTAYLNESKKAVSETALTPQKLYEMIAKIESGAISNAAGKKVFAEILVREQSVDELIAALGLSQISDTDALEKVVDEVLASNPKSIEDYKGGKTNALGFLVGQAMKATKGKGNPSMIKTLISDKLSSL